MEGQQVGNQLIPGANNGANFANPNIPNNFANPNIPNNFANPNIPNNFVDPNISNNFANPNIPNSPNSPNNLNTPTNPISQSLSIPTAPNLNPTTTIDNAYLPPVATLSDPASGRLAAEKARKAQIQQRQRLTDRLRQRKNPSATAAALTWDTTPAETEPNTNPNPISDADLVWPTHLIREITRARKPKNLPFQFARILFILGSLAALAIGPVQLIIIAASEGTLSETTLASDALTASAEYIHTTYLPLASKITLGFFILLDLILIPQLLKILQNLRETTNNPFTNVQPFSAKIRHRTLTYAFGLLALNLIVWFGVMFSIAPHILTILTAAAVLLTPFASLCIQRNVLPSRLGYMPFQIFLIALTILAGLEAVFNLLAFYEEPPEPIDYAAIERLAEAQKAARVEGVPPVLSDLIFAICGNEPYSVVFLSITDPNSGLFECNNHEVYSVTAPVETSEASENVIEGRAFYFGTTSDALIDRYFPAFTGARYLFRDFRPTAKTAKKTARADEQIPSELALLLPSTSDEELIINNLGSIANLLREHGDTDLRFSLFFNDSLDTVQTTRDFILIAAAGTITLNDWLPHGSSYSSIIDGQPGTYKFEVDHDLPALLDLGADPTLYSSQTRDAINSRRHITTIFSGIPNADALRTQLLDSFIEP